MGGVGAVADATTPISNALGTVIDCPLYGLGPDQVGDVLAGVIALEARMAGLRLRLVCASEAAGTAWLLADTRTDRAAAGRAVSEEQARPPPTAGQPHADAQVELARCALTGQCCVGGLPETES